ncbi:MAG: sensor histidine kinase [Anaerolineales bacterium]|nr:sensor histidine kinase [Anaerolineales bacterium]
MSTMLEPGLLRIFRYFTGVAALYFALLWGYTAIASGWVWATHVQLLTNFVANLILWGFLYWPWLARRLGRWYLPFCLGIATLIPVISNFVYLAEPYGVSATLMIVRSWLMLPTLVIPLVLIAWQYRFVHVLAFTIFTTAMGLIVLFAIMREITLETLPILAMPLIQAFAFGTVGHIVGQLMDTQRAQRRKLIQSNLQLGQYAETLEQLTISRERNRLARELHDTLAHTLSGLAINLEALKTTLDPAETETLRLADRSLQTARVGLVETRRALKDLRAQPLEDLGLCLSLRNLVSEAAERSGAHIDINIPEYLPALPPDVEQCVYRIAQEALENIVLHAQATEGRFAVAMESRHLVLRISDSGKGFALTNAQDIGQYGLQGMKERAAMIGGSLSIESTPEQGTCIQFTWEASNDQSINL